MNLNSFFLKSFRILLFPFAIVYGIVVIIRNKLYDKGYLKSVSFNFPIINVGNLSIGGTGKSPMVELLLSLLKNNYKTATLSRGYKRKTKGYVMASSNSNALEIGDEPMQFHTKFPEAYVAVCEERILGVPHILQDVPDLNVIILDDAYQHRAIKPGFNILLTDYNNLFSRDFFLPTGDLREPRSGYKRADIIVVTKCPKKLTEEERRKTIRSIEPLPHQSVYFASLEYDVLYQINNPEQKRGITSTDEVLLVTGIANPKPIKDLLLEKSHAYEQMDFSDHHIFTIDDLKEIKRKFERMDSQSKFILTTEKDAMRFIKFKDELNDLPFYVLPVRHNILFEEESDFNDQITGFIQQFKKNG